MATLRVDAIAENGLYYAAERQATQSTNPRAAIRRFFSLH
jgi:hypothetical protein